MDHASVSPEPPDLPPLTLSDVHKFKNKKAYSSVVPFVLRKVLEWGCSKNDEDDYWSYINKRRYRNHIKQKWSKEEIEALQTTSSDDFSISLLIKLIPLACENIDPPGWSVWTSGNPDRIECLLHEAIEYKNSWTSRPSAMLPQMEKTVLRLLRLAGDLYGIDSEDIAHEKDSAKRQLKDILEIPLSDDEKQTARIQLKLLNDGVTELKHSWRRYQESYMIPLIHIPKNRANIFHEIKLTYQTPFEEAPAEMSCLQILNKWPGLKNMSRIITLNGETGSGKSALLKRIAYDFFHSDNQNLVFENVKEYEFMVYIECPTNTSRNFEEWLAESLPVTLENISKQEAAFATHNFKILLLIDAVGDLDNEPMKLVKNTFNHFMTNMTGTCIISARPLVMSFLHNYLNECGHDYNQCQIKEINEPEDKITFLQRYENELFAATGKKVLNAFRSLRDDLRRSLVRPLQLVLFCSVQINSPDTLRRWSVNSSIFQHILEIIQNKMTDKLTSIEVDVVTTVRDLTKTLCTLSIRSLHEGTISLDERNLNHFFRNRHSKLPGNIDFRKLMTFSFVKSESLYSLPTRTVTFRHFHTNFQEYLSSLTLMRRLLINSEDSVQEILSDAVGKTVAVEHVKRYSEVIKFSMWQLMKESDNDLVERRLAELCVLLRDGGITSFHYWAEIIASCDYNRSLAKKAATVVDKTEWNVTSSRFMESLEVLIEFCSPNKINVNLPSTIATPSNIHGLLRAVVRGYRRKDLILNLRHNYWNYIPCNSYLALLQNAKFNLEVFYGCLSGSSRGIQNLPSVFLDGGVFHISLVDPFDHMLTQLDGCPHILDVTVKFPQIRVDTRVPLPRSSRLPPTLIIEGIPEGGKPELLVSLIRFLAPEDNRYWELSLRLCHLPDKDLDRVVNQLKSAGICTVCTQGQNEEDRVKKGWEEIGLVHADGIYCVGIHEEDVRCINMLLPSS